MYVTSLEDISLGLPNNSASTSLAVLETNLLGARHPIVRLATGLVGCSQGLVSVTYGLGKITTFAQMDTLPRSNETVKLSQRLGVEDGHGSFALLAINLLSSRAMDATNANSVLS